MKFLALIIATGVMVSSCHFGGRRIEGNGNVTSQERTVSSFDEVHVGGNFKVYVAQGDIQPVKLEGDENLLQYIELKQSGGEINIRSRDGVNLDGSSDLKIFLTAPKYRRIQVSGASDIIGEGQINNESDIRLSVSGAGDIKMDINAPAIDASVSGSGNILLKGEAKDFKMSISGAGKGRCYDLKAENTDVHITGAGDADVYASISLEARVSGAGSVSYKGDPKNVTQHVTGAGSVKRAD